MSSISKNKAQLLNSIINIFDKLCVDYEKISPELSRKLAIEGNVKGSQISVCDTLAYLIGWQKLVLKWYNRKEQRLPVHFPEEGFNWQQLGQLAEHFHQQYALWEYEALYNKFKSTTAQLIALVNRLDNEVLYGEPWYKSYSLGRMIQFNSSAPMKNTRTRVRRFIKENS